MTPEEAKREVLKKLGLTEIEFDLFKQKHIVLIPISRCIKSINEYIEKIEMLIKELEVLTDL